MTIEAEQYWFLKNHAKEEPSFVYEVGENLVFYRPYPLSKPWMVSKLERHVFTNKYRKEEEGEIAFYFLTETGAV